MTKTKKFNIRVLPLGMLLGSLAIAVGLVQHAMGHPSPAGTVAATKIGVISLERAIVATNEGQKEYSQLQQQFAPRQADMKARQDEITKMQNSLKADASKLSEADRNTRVKEIETKQRDFNRNMQQAQSDAQQAEQQLFAKLSPKMMNVIEHYATTHGYSVILDASSPASSVLYASTGANITKQVVDAYNASGTGSGSSPSTPAASPAASASPSK